MADGSKMKRVIFRIVGFVVGGIFVYAGILKVGNPAQFAADIDNFSLLTWWPSVALLALYLPWLEIVCGAALIFRRLHFGAALILTALTSGFLFALATAKVRGLDISCGCFGHGDSSHLSASLLLDAAILCALIFLLTTEWKDKNKAGMMRNQSRETRE